MDTIYFAATPPDAPGPPQSPGEPPQVPPDQPPPASAPNAPRPVDPSRTGTLWVGATGVALLLAAAGVLTAVRWGDIGQTAKLSGFVAITLAMLFAGHRFRDRIPLTARAIFHFGALLIPLDMAAVAFLAHRTWEETLLMTSLAALASWFALLHVDRSPVLVWATRASVVVAAAGVAAVSPVGLPLAMSVVAVVAALAVAARFDRLLTNSATKPTGRSALAWTAAAGALPLAFFVEWPSRIAIAADELGYTVADRPSLIVASVLAAVAAAVLAWAQPSLERGWLAVALAAVAAGTAASAFATISAWLVCLAVLFVVFEASALAVRSSDDWAPLVRDLMPLVELTAALTTLVVFTDVSAQYPTPTHVLPAALLLLGWFTADRRRVLEPNDWVVGLLYGADWALGSIAIAASAVLLAAAAGASTPIISGVLLGSAAWMVATRRSFRSMLAIVAAVGAVAITNLGWAGVATFAAAALLLAVTARFERDRELATVIAGLPGLVLAAAWQPLTQIVAAPVVAAAVLAAGAWLLGYVIDHRDALRADLPRLVSLACLGFAFTFDPVDGLLIAGLVAALAAGEALRSGQMRYAVAAAVAMAIAVLPAATLVGFSEAQAGVVMAAAAMVAVGVLVALPRGHVLGHAIGAGAVTLGAVGLALAEASAATLSPALVLVGVAVLLVGAALDELAISGLGGVVVIGGTWLQLADWQVDWLEAYLALPTLVALGAGYRWHQSGVSSWLAFAPTIAFVGAIAASERFLGGSAWHAVIAGGIGVVAVAAGGAWRLVGPLLTGTVLIAAVTIYESLGPGSRVPTWGWLALGGTVLVAAAVVMERAETTPLEQGQRVVHVLSTRFS